MDTNSVPADDSKSCDCTRIRTLKAEQRACCDPHLQLRLRSHLQQAENSLEDLVFPQCEEPALVGVPGSPVGFCHQQGVGERSAVQGG